MAAVFGEVQWCSSPVAYWKCDVETSRSGANVTYAFTFTVRFTGTYTWFNNGLAVVLSLDGTSKGQKQIKAQTSGQIGAKSYTLSWSETISKTSGTTSFSATLKDTNSGNNRSTKTADLSVPAAASVISSTWSGKTYGSSGGINITKYDSSFYCEALYYYGNTLVKTHTNVSTSDSWPFGGDERWLVYDKQGANSTATWNVTLKTWTNSSKTSYLGESSGSFTIQTEPLETFNTAPANFNVESSITCKVGFDCGAINKVVGYLGGYRTGTKICESDYIIHNPAIQTVTFNASSSSSSGSNYNYSSIYSSNTSSQTGTVYWTVYTYLYIDGQYKLLGNGYRDAATCTYTFLQSLCGPSLSTFTYAIADNDTRTLMSSNGSNYNYNDNTDKGKFIKGKTTLTLRISGSANTGKNASISSYYFNVPGQGDIYTTGTSGTQSITTSALASTGTITATIKDSRKFTTQLSFTYSLNEYWTSSFQNPTAVRNAMSATDPNADKIAKLSVTISLPSYIASYIKNNTSTYSLKFKYSSNNGSSWTTNSTNLLSSCTLSGNTLKLTNYATTALFTQTTQYLLAFVLVDYYQTVTSTNVIIPISAPLISRRSQKVGINKIPGSYTLDVGGTFHCDGNATIGGNASVGGIITSHGKQLQSYFSINLSSQSTSNFYPVTFLPESEELECEIHSPGFSSSAAYNQNIIHFIVSSSGWCDTPVYVNILNYKNHTNSEVTIGCIGKGNSGSYDVCVWLRGGFTYSFYSNFTPTLHTSSYTGGGSSPSTFTVGTNYYGGSNTNVTILFTPQSTITKGSYQSEDITAGGTVTAGTDIKANSGFLYSVNNGVTTKIGGGNSSFTHYYSTSGKHWFDHPVYVAGDIYGGSSYNKKVAYYEQIPTNNNQLTNGAGYITGYASTGTATGAATSTVGAITWTYIKFTNGYAVCWGTATLSTAINSSWGGGYLSGSKYPPNFPFTFTSTPTVIKTMTNATSSQTYAASIMSIGGNNPVSTSYPGGFCLFRASSASSQSYSISIVAWGKWN